MKITRLSCWLIILLSSALNAGEVKKPAGIWELTANSIIAVRYPDGKQKAIPANSLRETIQLGTNGDYNLIPFRNAAAKWKPQKGGKSFKINIDRAKFSTFELQTPFENALLNNFLTLAKQKYGSNPAIINVEAKKYLENGKLTTWKKRPMLQGTIKAQLTINYTNPVSKKQESASLTSALKYFGFRFSAPSDCCSASTANEAINLESSNTFLTDNSTLFELENGKTGARPFKTTASGLQYLVIYAGTTPNGAKPGPNSNVALTLRGILPSGEQIYPLKSNISLNMNTIGIQGLAEGLQLMTEGAYFRLYMPPSLAFGKAGLNGTYPNSAVIFDVVLDKIQ